MKDLLKKLYPEHDAGTAGFISALLLTAILTTIITISDALGQGADEYQLGFIGLCVLLAAGTYHFGKSSQRIGK